MLVYYTEVRQGTTYGIVLIDLHSHERDYIDFVSSEDLAGPCGVGLILTIYLEGSVLYCFYFL